MLFKTIIKTSLLFICLFHIVTSTAQSNYSYCSLKPISKDEKASYKVAKNSKIKVFVFYSPDCPICKTLILHLNKIHKQYEKKAVDFHIVIPSSLHYSKKDLENHPIIDSLHLPIFIDKKDKLVKQLKATVTPQVVVVHETKIIYSGMLNDLYVSLGVQKKSALQYFLVDALEAQLKQEEVKIKSTIPIGCYINSNRK